MAARVHPPIALAPCWRRLSAGVSAASSQSPVHAPRGYGRDIPSKLRLTHVPERQAESAGGAARGVLEQPGLELVAQAGWLASQGGATAAAARSLAARSTRSSQRRRRC